MTEQVLQLRRLIQGAGRIVFFGGAGVSTESGIPDFRSAHGLYAGAQGRSYEEMLSIGFFEKHPEEFWRFYREVMLYPQARPNPAHLALSRLEEEGKLAAVVTQNIDGLHQTAGSRRVLELHGSVWKNRCTRCRHPYSLEEVLPMETLPRCPRCGGILKPEVTLYGEALDDDITREAVEAIRHCDLLLVGGTSLVVYPAAGFVTLRPRSAPLVLINRDETPYDRQADLIIRENIATVLSQAVGE